MKTCGQRGHENWQGYCFCMEREGHTGMHRCADGYEWQGFQHYTGRRKRRKPEARVS